MASGSVKVQYWAHVKSGIKYTVCLEQEFLSSKKMSRKILCMRQSILFSSRATMTTELEVKNLGTYLYSALTVEEFMKRFNLGIIVVRFTL